ncbi:MAG TPA: hypothetical protein VIX90_04560 [Edaphobacter sp.]
MTPTQTPERVMQAGTRKSILSPAELLVIAALILFFTLTVLHF